MNLFDCKRQCQAIAIVLIFFSGVLCADMPANEYACQVTTTSARLGIVLVQADDRQAASKIASRSQARTFSGDKEPTATVVECILYSSEEFRDADVQRLFEQSAG